MRTVDWNQRTLRKLLALALVFVLLATSLPAGMRADAATSITSPGVRYNTTAGTWELFWTYGETPGSVSASWHNPDGTVSTVTTAMYSSGQAVLACAFQPDHIYDITIRAYSDGAWTTLVVSRKIYMLVDVTFTGESFNQMALFSDIEDKAPDMDGATAGSAVIVRSGGDPVVKLKWKIPTLYCDTDGDAIDDGTVRYITDRTSTDPATVLALADTPISDIGFQIEMNRGKGSNDLMVFNTQYVASGGTERMSLIGYGTEVSDLVDGVVTSSNGYVSLTLTKTEGIEPGTEYEAMNIGIITKNSAGQQVPLRRTNLSTQEENRFMVTNVDNAFADYGTTLTSVFTPMYFEMTKVDIDKVEVRFRKITNGVYPELYYQVQFASRIDDLYAATDEWPKIPDASLAASELYGSTIVEYDLTGTTHPELYFRVVFYDSGQTSPRNSSLAVNLQNLGIETGKPPFPREVVLTPVYAGREDVTLYTGATVEIPANDLTVSIEKPLSWREKADWETFRATANADEDYVFHILVSTRMPDSGVTAETGTVGLDTPSTIYMPVRQKRVLVLGKKDFTEDPDDPDRLIATIDGTAMFRDQVLGTSIAAENNEDPSGDTVRGDYPTFLVPNTTYYAQLFTSRYGDLAAIDADVWGDSSGLSTTLLESCSYTSPVTTFTTYPLAETPVPLPEFSISAEPQITVDPDTGEVRLTGISVSYDRLLTDAEWSRYTSAVDGRVLRYQTWISKSTDAADFVLASTDDAVYPDEATETTRGFTLSGIPLPGGGTEVVLANTTYYIKMRATLLVGGIVIGQSEESAVQSITTPKVDTGTLDDITRYPRTPVEFTIAEDSDGNQLLSDAWVDLTWSHIEQDVVYEMIVTTTGVGGDADPDDYLTDTDNAGFLAVYNDFREPAGDSVILIDPSDSALGALGFTYGAETKVIVMPIRRTYLQPNRQYWFSLRAVRNRNETDSSGASTEKTSAWVTIPVTTKTVTEPESFEAVKDLEVGFNVTSTASNTTKDSFEIYMKKTDSAAGTEVILRSHYTCVKDGTTLYWRVYNLDANTWYDFYLYDTVHKTWYDSDTAVWKSAKDSPVQMQTRNTLKEIEIRWAGQEPYDYFFEMRAESEADYSELSYSATATFSDYGYELDDGTRIEFYREKTQDQVVSGSTQYMYYTLIRGKPVTLPDGTVDDRVLATNTHYYVKMWSYNVDDSLHVGPVDVRTDFSQDDYDKEQDQEGIDHLFTQAADKLTQKLWWNIDRNATGKMRVLLKADRISAIFATSPGMTLVIDLDAERSGVDAYEAIIPQAVLEALDRTGARLTLRTTGADVTISRGSFDLAALKASVAATSVTETMAVVTVASSAKGTIAVPAQWTSLSKIYGLTVKAAGSTKTYAEIADVIEAVLTDETATGTFKYGILDRELAKLETAADTYSYRSRTDLIDLIDTLVGRAETEMSGYLGDLLDGGSGYAAALTKIAEAKNWPGTVLVGVSYEWQSGRITPISLESGASAWTEPDGVRAYVGQTAIFRVDGPSQVAVAAVKSVTIVQNPTDGSAGSAAVAALTTVAGRYDLSKVFGTAPVYPGNTMTGREAVLLFEVVTDRGDETTGMTMAEKIATLGLAEVMPVRSLANALDRQHAVSIAVLIYGERAGIPPARLAPTRNIVISNQSSIDAGLLTYVRTGVDLKMAALDSAGRFDAAATTNVGAMMDMIVAVMDLLGEN